jgi:hypothetical protein
MFRAVILLRVQYGARTEGVVKPTEAMRVRHQRDSSSARHISRRRRATEGARRVCPLSMAAQLQ